MADTAYLIFLGFPVDVETAKPDSRSKRRPNRKPGISERPYNGAAPETRGWRPGEPRKLTTQGRLNRSTGKVDTIFDAPTFASHVLLDFGADSEAWTHRPEAERAHYGFRSLTEAEYNRKRKAWDKRVAAAAAEAAA